MSAIRIHEGASHRLDDIYRYTWERWGDEQADEYITGLFAAFDKIATRGVTSKPIPAEFECGEPKITGYREEPGLSGKNRAGAHKNKDFAGVAHPSPDGKK